ncbi:MAG: MBL fold metallo-hydrolase [Chloroflexi bacterium]|nr:MBL fold metallo-hydrolase [Chloroflexota bacterium]
MKELCKLSLVLMAVLITILPLLTACDDDDKKTTEVTQEPVEVTQEPTGGETPESAPPVIDEDVTDILDDPTVRAEGTNVGELINIAQGVDQINDFIYLATGLANIYVVTTPQGHVVVDTGLYIQASSQYEALKAVIPDAPITHIILPQAQQDDIGGVDLWSEEGTEIVMTRATSEYTTWRKMVNPILESHFGVLYPWGFDPTTLPEDHPMRYQVVEPTIIVEDHETYEFEVGGVQFEVIPLPGAEGANSTGLWLPEHKVLLCGGGFVGPIWPMWPNFGTVRGDRGRLVMPYVDSINRVLELEPEVLLVGNGEPAAITDKEEIKQSLILIRDAMIYVHDAVLQGLSERKDVYQLMREIKLLPEYDALSLEHGKVEWVIREIVNQYGFWFQYKSTTELYPIPVTELYVDIVELAGVDALIQRATERLKAGELVDVLHFTEMVLAGDPGNRSALQIQLDAINALMEEARNTTNNFSEIALLQAQIKAVEELLAE